MEIPWLLELLLFEIPFLLENIPTKVKGCSTSIEIACNYFPSGLPPKRKTPHEMDLILGVTLLNQALHKMSTLKRMELYQQVCELLSKGFNGEIVSLSTLSSLMTSKKDG